MSEPKPITWTTARLRLADLVPWEANPRITTDADAKAIGDSLDAFGVVDPLVANFDRISLIGGHTRRLLLLAPERLGPDAEVDVRLPDRQLSPEEARRLALMLNRAHGQWDWSKLANDFEVPELELAGFTLDDFDPIIPVKDPTPVPTPKNVEVECPKCGERFKPKA